MKRQTITISILLAASLTILSGCGASNTDTKSGLRNWGIRDMDRRYLYRNREREKWKF